MSESLIEANRLEDQEDIDGPLAQVSFHIVRDTTIVPAVEDETGRVIIPAIDTSTGLMPNGQKIITFFERGKKGVKADQEAKRALGRATKILRGADY